MIRIITCTTGIITITGMPHAVVPVSPDIRVFRSIVARIWGNILILGITITEGHRQRIIYVYQTRKSPVAAIIIVGHGGGEFGFKERV